MATRHDWPTLTKVEFQLMSIIWEMDGSVCAWDVQERMDEPRPAYTTVATYLKILCEKGFLAYHKEKGQGKTHRFVPLVTKAEYTRRTLQDVKRDFFGGSVRKMLSFFVSEEKLSEEEVRELLEMANNNQPLP